LIGSDAMDSSEITCAIREANGGIIWGSTFRLRIVCGSMKMGQVIGRSTEKGESIVVRPIPPQDVSATIFQHLGIDARKVHFTDTLARPTALVETGVPVRELWG
jgi:Protein of unknown function (DUF1501)